MAVASSFLISGLYFLFVAIFVIVTPDTRQRKIGPIIGISAWGVMTAAMGFWGIAVGG